MKIRMTSDKRHVKLVLLKRRKANKVARKARRRNRM